MSKEFFCRITTVDTKKTYELPDKNNPQLWRIRLSISLVEDNGSENAFSHNNDIYVERYTLENAGLLPMCEERVKKMDEPTETAEDLILRLLGHVGVFPTE